MIKIYCANKHGGEELCDQCGQLLLYAQARLDNCKHGEQKLPCKNCTTHCYNPARRQQMQAVMRYAGPRMLLRAPFSVISHYFK